MIKEQFFPTTIYAKDIKLDNQLFTNEIVEWSKKDPGLQKTNKNGWHSTTEMHELPVFQPLVNELFLMMNDIWKEEWLDREPILGNMWANINPPGGYNVPHIHPNSLFSGVYYIKAPKNSGRKEGKLPKELWREVYLEPVEGRIIIFPYYLWHNVTPNKSNDIRISVSFNFIQHGF